MRREFPKLSSRLLLAVGLGVIATLSLTGCWKKSGDAIVLDKEHIAAREVTPTPAADSSAYPSPSKPSPIQMTSGEVQEPRELAPDEIVVDTYIMKKDVRGTSRDPRALTNEQWIVTVEMVSDLRRIGVHTDKAHWDKLKIGDRTHVTYKQGKYTGTVWDADID
jgi:hypothetical protein